MDRPRRFDGAVPWPAVALTLVGVALLALGRWLRVESGPAAR
jgi:hypothetical protein